jgi:hypothetical protein
MKLIFRTTSFALLVLSTLAVWAQNAEPVPALKSSDFVDATPEPCWSDELKLAQLTQHTPKDKTFIIIARAGDKDSKRELNRRRLYNIRAYMTQLMGERYGRDPEKIILAEGEPIKGFGQVEFYLDGRLVEVIKTRPNGDLIVDCYGGIDGQPPCAEDWQKLFYPCKDYIEKRKQKLKRGSKKRPTKR